MTLHMQQASAAALSLIVQLLPLVHLPSRPPPMH
jgi:hypothetical protein